jgi:hypothetical protein
LIKVSGSCGSGLALEIGVGANRREGRVKETKMRIRRKEILRQGRQVKIELTRKVTS